MIISKKGRSLAYTSHQDGLIDLRPGYRVSVNLHDVTIVSLSVCVLIIGIKYRLLLFARVRTTLLKVTLFFDPTVRSVGLQPRDDY